MHDFDEWACSEKGVCFVDTISLYYFTEAANDLNFTQTASRLFLSQQNLSSHIARWSPNAAASFFSETQDAAYL